MSRKLVTIAVVVLFTLALVPVVLAAPSAEEVTGGLVSCDPDTGEVVIDTNGDAEGGEETVDISGDPDFIADPEGTCAGLEAESGDVMVDGEIVTDEDSVLEHPVVARIAEQTGLSYDEVWEIFREGFSYTAGECTDDPATPEDECADAGEPCTDDPATPEDECADAGNECTDDPATPEDECTFTYEGVVGLGRIMMAIRLEERLTNLGWDWQHLLAYHLQGNGWGQLMVADKLAEDSDMSAEELLAYREGGGNWGDIHQAAKLAEDGEHTVEELLDMRAECNWGQIRKGECGGGSEATSQSQGQGQGQGRGQGQGGGRPENPGSNGRGGGNPHN